MARQQGFTPIVGGDFNMDSKSSTRNKLKLWVEENQLINILGSAISAPYCTHMMKGKGVSCIDHIYIQISVNGQIYCVHE